MAHAKPIPMSASTLAAFNVPAEVRAWALPSQRFAHQPEAFLRGMDQACLLTLIGSPVAPIYRLLYGAHLIEIGLADCFVQDVDLSVLVRHGLQPSQALVRAILDQTPGWTFRQYLDLSLQMFPGHPAVGRGAADRLAHGRVNGLRRSPREVLRWHAGRTGTALAAAGAPTDAQAVTPALVRSLTVPHILAGAGGDVVRYVAERPEFGESEPLLLAAAAIARSRLDVAESAMHRAEAVEAVPQRAEATEFLNVALLRLAASSQRGDGGAGLAAASGLMDLMGGLTAAEREQASELQPLIDYYVAGCEWSMGRLDAARSRLQIGAGSLERFQGLDESGVEQLVRANCAGRLAWLDAFCGSLRRSMRYATAVLTTRRADTSEIGVRFAQLATVLVHTERGEIEQAKQRLDHAVSLSADDGEPLLAAAQLVTQIRLAMITDGPAAVLRQLQEIRTLGSNATTGWFAEQFTLATADAYLAAGEARRAITLLASVPPSAAGDASLLLARAHRVAGDLSLAEAALAQTGSHSAVNTLAIEVRRWLLLAQLHAERNDIQVAGILVDRALSAASSEALVETVRESDGWLRSFVARDSRLSARHSSFLASLGYDTASRMPRRPEKSDSADAVIAVPLTARETDVLNLLADYCSNEEIAADLVVSMNTVKTHIRSLFQKLSVTRRADAVRRGRALGLC